MSFIPLSEAKRENFFAPKEPKEMKWEKDGKSGTFTRTYISYRNEDKTGKVTNGHANFEVEGEVLIKKTDYGKITTTLHLTNPRDVIGAKEANAGAMNCIMQQKGPLKMPNFNPASPPDGMRTVYFHETDKNGIPIEGKEPMIYLHMDESSEFRFLSWKEVTVKDETGKEITKKEFFTQKIPNPDVLVGKVLTGSIVFSIRDIYKGSAIMVQSYIRTITIVSMCEAQSIDALKYSSYLDKVMADARKNPDMMTQLQAKMQELNVSQPVSLLIPNNGPVGQNNAPAAQAGSIVISQGQNQQSSQNMQQIQNQVAQQIQSSIPQQQVVPQQQAQIIPGIPVLQNPQVFQQQPQPVQQSVQQPQAQFQTIPQQQQIPLQQQQTVQIPQNAFQQPTSFSAPVNFQPAQQSVQQQPSQDEQLKMFLNSGPSITQIPQLVVKTL